MSYREFLPDACNCVACRIERKLQQDIEAIRDDYRNPHGMTMKEATAIIADALPQPSMMRATVLDLDLTARVREIQREENRYQQCRHSFDSRCICLYCGDHYAAATARGERTSFPEDNYQTPQQAAQQMDDGA